MSTTSSTITFGSVMFQLLCVAALLAFVSAQSITTCNIASSPSISNQCPPGLVLISDGNCCPQANVRTETPTTTARATTSAPCVDKLNPSTGVSDCPKNVGLCTNSVYIPLMKDQCPKTCGFCTGAGVSCVDKINPKTGTSDCPKKTPTSAQTPFTYRL
ncbi:unnamed protein product [Caenorhabditis auriculariae]|uniref:ShKT domain-containing protein n=1 Tax=Caenorhabditis auriculariae TaxID=2777116 RepID=A0A8S1GWG2_9PELO|nr:unnamed protein product [Caenorhabditis auriculariae]